MSAKTPALVGREYQQIVRRKAFLIGTFLTPAFFALFTVLPAYLVQRNTSPITLAVWDETGEVTPRLAGEVETFKLDDGRTKYTLQVLETSQENLEDARRKVKGKGIRGVLTIPGTFYASGQAVLEMRSLTEFRVQEELGRALSSVLREHRLAERGLDSDLVQSVLRPAAVEVRSVLEEKEQHVGGVIGVAMAFSLILYIMLIMYGVMIINGVVEDKTSRVYEVMLSCVSARQLLLGKVLGVGLAALTQLSVWAVGFFLVTSIRPIAALQNISISPATIAVLVTIFLVSFLLYSMLYAGVGSLCSSMQDAQQMQWPILVFLVAPAAMLGALMMEPDGVLAVTLSLFPMTAPVVMPLRIGLSAPGIVQIAACLVLIATTALAVYYAAGKVFRTAILVHGKRASWRQVVRWLRETEG